MVPERYAHASPIKLLPLGVPQVFVIGEHEDFLPRSLAEAYATAAAQAGDSLRLIVIPHVGHFEIASPLTTPWRQVSLQSGHYSMEDYRRKVRPLPSHLTHAEADQRSIVCSLRSLLLYLLAA